MLTPVCTTCRGLTASATGDGTGAGGRVGIICGAPGVTARESNSTVPVTRVAAARSGYQTGGNDFQALIGGERNLRLPYTQRTDVLTDAVDRLAAACGEIHATDEPRRAGSTLDLIA